MAKLINKTKLDITLPSRHVIPGDGELETTNDVIRGDNWAVMQGRVAIGEIVIEMDPEEEAGDKPVVKKSAVEKTAK